MTMSHDVCPGLLARDFQPRVGLGPTFSSSGLDASWAVVDAQLSDEPEKQRQGVIGCTRQAAHNPFAPQLHGVFEAQAPWRHMGSARGLCHERSDQIVGEKVHPDLLLVHLGRVAAELGHLQGGLDRAQIELDVPSQPKELAECSFANLTRVQKARDQGVSEILCVTA